HWTCSSLLLSLFFLIVPHPPRPTLFPYTTLFRSRERIGRRPQHAREDLVPHGVAPGADGAVPDQVLLLRAVEDEAGEHRVRDEADRKSTRLNSSHRTISYAVFCLKKKKKRKNNK